MNLLGVIHGYNEEDCIGNAIECLLNAQHTVHVFDHGSTDGTAAKIQSYPGVHYHYLDRTKVPFHSGSNHLYATLSAFIRSQAAHYDWVTWMDADEVLMGANGLPLHQAIEVDWKRGNRVIRGTIHEYWITEKDNRNEPDYMKRLKYYRVRGPLTAGGICRGWAIHLTGEMQRGRHRKQWPEPISDWEYVLKHYPIRSIEHGTRKIMKERLWENKGDGTHYKPYRQANCNNLVKPSAGLQTD